MIDYTPTELKEIAEINEDSHIALLTDCGIAMDAASKIITMTDADLADAVDKFESVGNKTAMQIGVVQLLSCWTMYRITTPTMK